MRDQLRELAKKPAIHLVVLTATTLSAITGGLFVEQITVAVSFAMIAAAMLVALLLREWHHREAGDAALEGRKTIEDLHVKLNRARNALNRVTAESDHHFCEDVVITHRIPRTGEDETTRSATTRVDDGASLRWRRLRFNHLGATGAPASSTFHLRQAMCDGNAMDHAEIADSGTTREIVFMLGKVLRRNGDGDGTARWEVTYARSGTWDPLREIGEDQLYFRNTYRSTRTQIQLIFVGWDHPPTDFLRREPHVGRVEARPGNGGHVLEWTVDDPEPGRLHTAWVRAR